MLRPSTPRPLALDLCYDVLAPLCSATQREEYLSGGGRGGGGRAAAARAILWDSLRAAPGPGGLKASLRVCVTSGGGRPRHPTLPSPLQLPSSCFAPSALQPCAPPLPGEYVYLRSPADLRRLLLSPPPDLLPATHLTPERSGSPTSSSTSSPTGRLTASHLAAPPDAPAAHVAAGGASTCSLLEAGSLVEAGAAVEHCHLPAGCVVGAGALLSGVQSLPAGTRWPEGVAGFEIVLRSAAAAAAAGAREAEAEAEGTSAPQYTASTPTRPPVHRQYTASTPSAAAASSSAARLRHSADGDTDPEGEGCAEQDARSCRLLLLWLDELAEPGEAGGAALLARCGASAAQLWADGAPRTAWHARLFPLLRGGDDPVAWWPLLSWLAEGRPPPAAWEAAPRLSWLEAAAATDLGATLRARARLASRVALRAVRARLAAPEPSYLRHLLARLACGGAAQLRALLAVLDEIAADGTPRLATRAFAAIADALALRAGQRGGLRSGPAANGEWGAALRMLRGGELRAAVTALAEVRAAWIGADEPRMLVRAARHYEGAVAECISCCVRTCVATATVPPEARRPQRGAWVVCEAPARLDLAGGWSDTPPICYEHAAGGVVINAAIQIDGRCPIGARARRIDEPVLRITIDPAAGPIIVSELSGMEDYNSPLAPGALPKCVLLFCGVVSLSDPEGRTLAEQLASGGGGLELESWSHLPTGSGLGTSSILAAALVAAVGLASGRDYAPEALTHAVLQVEQMLTTGGGWQDQAGGILPGFKRCSSAAALPLRVVSRVLPLAEGHCALLSRHLQLVYTGKTRLARNLLQDVLRRWHSANPAILDNVRALVATAAELEKSLLQPRAEIDVAAVGRCVASYWEQKKRMCDAEPEAVSRMLAKLRPLVHGATLTGAGGGGFLLLVTKEPDAREAVRAALADEQVVLHDVCIDQQGLRTRFEAATS